MSNSTPKHKVYLLECQGIYKVGYAKNLKSRLSSIQTSNPHPVKLVDSFPSDFPYSDEQEIHSKLKNYHHNGEWYKIPKKWIENRGQWFRPTMDFDSHAIEKMNENRIKNQAKFAAAFFSNENFKELAGVKNDADARYLKRYAEHMDDDDFVFDEAVERCYEQFLRSGFTHDESVAKVKAFVEKEIALD